MTTICFAKLRFFAFFFLHEDIWFEGDVTNFGAFCKRLNLNDSCGVVKPGRCQSNLIQPHPDSADEADWQSFGVFINNN